MRNLYPIQLIMLVLIAAANCENIYGVGLLYVLVA